jgi:hypothetical protein
MYVSLGFGTTRSLLGDVGDHTHDDPRKAISSCEDHEILPRVTTPPDEWVWAKCPFESNLMSLPHVLLLVYGVSRP